MWGKYNIMDIGKSVNKDIHMSVFMVKMKEIGKISDLFNKTLKYSIYSENDLTWRIEKNWILL